MHFQACPRFLEGANFFGGLRAEIVEEAGFTFRDDGRAICRGMHAFAPCFLMNGAPDASFPGLGRERKAGRCRHEEWEIALWTGRVFGLERAFPANRGRGRRFSGISTDTARQGRFYCSFSLRMISESTR